MNETKRRAAPPSAAPFAHSRRNKLEEPRFLVVGRVVAPRGIRGELKVRPETDDPSRFSLLDEVFMGDHRERFAVREVRFFKEHVLLRLHGIDTPEQADLWRDAVIWIPEEEGLALAEDQYYYHQIEGLTAVTVEGEVLGRVMEVLPTGANDVYVVRSDREEILLPAIKDVIVRVDLAAGLVVVRLVEGLR
jgi:16S rRNA processing protein RimM